MNSPLKNASKKTRKSDQADLPDKGLNRPRSFKRVLTLIALSLFAVLLSCLGAVAAVEVWPSLGAQVANHLRNLVGPRPVAWLEAVVFQVQDAGKHWRYRWGLEQAKSPWGTPSKPTPSTPSSRETQTPTPLRLSPTPLATPAEQPGDQPAEAAISPTPYVWQLSPLTPFGSMDGEGVWQPYLHDQEGRVVAERTFLQPDPERPYTIVAVVAFDLTRTRLRFVLGFNEPSLPEGPKGDGLIPEEHRQAGVLLAAFNGGFRAANGHFGAMAGGVEALPPIDDFATVGIYRYGEVRIGNWGQDIVDTPELESWRQNCRLIIDDGEISPRVYNDSVTDWGASIKNQIVTRRSGLGLDQEAKTLYYFAGPSLSMPALADAMLTAGVEQGMLLDINNFQVHFTAIRPEQGELVAEPLLPEEMFDQVDRYLGPSPVDFFYLTLLERD